MESYYAEMMKKLEGGRLDCSVLGMLTVEFWEMAKGCDRIELSMVGRKMNMVADALGRLGYTLFQPVFWVGSPTPSCIENTVQVELVMQ